MTAVAPIKPLDPLSVPLTGTHLIEASAGTGKTHTVSTLYVRLLLEQQRSVGEILVVTYTNAATAELRTRIRGRLHAALAALQAGGSGDPDLDRLVQARLRHADGARDRARLLAALHGFDEAAIFTIHGFCQRMLQDHAFESGVPFDTELITNERPLLSEVIGDFWVRELYAAPDDFVRYLHDERSTPSAFERLAAQVIAHPEITLLPERVAASPTPEEAFAARHVQLQLDLVRYTRSELRRRKAAAHVQSYDDLLQQLAAALRRPAGETLARAIRARFGAALIDEFQDTDPVQYDIFRRIYLATDATLFLIGDPKQAIYTFRGADVFTYLQAKRATQAYLSTLETNWRSDPSLIRAVNHLFTRTRAAFVLDEIEFRAAIPAPPAVDALGGAAAGEAPLQILFVRRTGQEAKDGHINKTWDGIAPALASEIARFLERGVQIAEQPVVPNDIAVICRKNAEARTIQTALRALGVPSVLQTEGSVFDTPEAVDVERVLRAIVDPADARAVRAALATALFGVSANDLYALQRDEHAWDTWVARFQEWHACWLRRGFVAAFRDLLETCAVAPRLLALPGGERQLTNVLHLMELLHAAGVEERRGPLALLHWLGQMRTDDTARADLGGEAEQIRLESDADAVRVVTVHKAKGLQYPIVYCPYLWDGRLLLRHEHDQPRFHDSAANDRLTLDIGSPALVQHRAIAEREALAENLRLLYVALTRAQHRCSVVWGAFRDADTSALGYLLHAAAAGGDVRERTAQRIAAFIDSRSDEGMRAELDALAAASQGAIAVTELPPAAARPYAAAAATAHVLTSRTVQRPPMWLDWRTSSFSALVSSAEISQPAAEGVDHDENAADTRSETGLLATPSVGLQSFPGGARSGQLIHTIFQYLDFFHTDQPALREQVAATLARFGYDAYWTDTLCAAVTNVLDTPLDGTGLRLRMLPLHQRLNELEFLFPIADASSSRSSVSALTAMRLAKQFRRHATPAVTPDYADRLARLGFAPLTGFLRGFVDLVFEHDGRWYVVDYKSNRLGPRPSDYEPARLTAVMIDHHYVLQYLLYVVALHRYLRLRQPGYDYDRHIGGVYYLFVRGMSPDYPLGNGIFADRPARGLVEALSELMEGHPA